MHRGCRLSAFVVVDDEGDFFAETLRPIATSIR